MRQRPQRTRPSPRLLYQLDPIRESTKALGTKWTLLVLRDIGFLGLERFGEILRNNPGLTPRVLSRRLRNMQQEGLIHRTVKTDRVTYKLTARGEDAAYVLLAFLRYGIKYHARDMVLEGPKPVPSFRELVREYDLRTRQGSRTKNQATRRPSW